VGTRRVRHPFQHSEPLNPHGETVRDPAELADAKLSEGIDLVEKASEDSFPASDPPGYAGTPPPVSAPLARSRRDLVIC